MNIFGVVNTFCSELPLFLRVSAINWSETVCTDSLSFAGAQRWHVPSGHVLSRKDGSRVTFSNTNAHRLGAYSLPYGWLQQLNGVLLDVYLHFQFGCQLRNLFW